MRTNQLARAVLLSLSAAAVCWSQTIWIPSGVKVLRGARISIDHTIEQPLPNQHQDWLEKAEFALIAFDSDNIGTREKIEGVLRELAQKTGHPEIENIPFVNSGFSYTSCLANEFAANVPDRMICLVASGCGGLPSLGDKDTAMIEMPVMYIAQSGDFYAKAMNLSFGEFRRHKARWSLAAQGGTHAFANCDVLFKPFQDQCIRLRVPEDWDPLKGPPRLRSIPLEQSWIGIRDVDWFGGGRKFPKIFPYAGHAGDLNNAVWLPNEYVARVWQAFMSTGNQLTMTSPAMSDNRWYNTAPFGQTHTVDATCTATNPERVEFYDGCVQITSMTVPPYTTTVQATAPGIHSFAARAYLRDGTILNSYVKGILQGKGPGLSVTLGVPENIRPQAGSTVSLRAFPRTTSGSVTKVEFFVDGVSIGSVSSAPYAVNWTPGRPGEHVVTAAATNDRGETVVSMPDKYTVTDQPVAALVVTKPRSAYVRPGAKVRFEASVRDQYGYALSPQPAVSWSASGGGTIAGGEFTAGGQLGGMHTVSASVAGLQGNASVAVSNAIRVNFSPSFIQVDGFLNDAGGAYGPKSNGLSYGWCTQNADGSAGAPSGLKHGRVREVDLSIYGWEVASHLNMTEQLEVPWNKSWSTKAWQIDVPNGDYLVKVVAGDPTPVYDLGQLQSQIRTTQFVIKIKVEDQVIIDDTAKLGASILTRTKEITVNDGKLTMTSGHANPQTADCPNDSKGIPPLACREKMNKVCYIEIVPKTDPPLVTVQPPAVRSRLSISLRRGAIEVQGGGGNLSMALVNLEGRRIQRLAATGTCAVMSLKTVPSGTYVVCASSGNTHLSRRITVYRGSAN